MFDELSMEELDAELAVELPDREAMSWVNVMVPVNITTITQANLALAMGRGADATTGSNWAAVMTWQTNYFHH